MRPPSWKALNELLGKGRGQVQVALQVVTPLDQRQKEVQLLMCKGVKGKSNDARRPIQWEHGKCEA